MLVGTDFYGNRNLFDNHGNQIESGNISNR